MAPAAGQAERLQRPQYFAEHAPPEKNILIRAGAGTGKTHTMISRVGYICYSQKVPLRQMARRIVMITFTNEAADQMAEKLKTYFRNCYLITGRAAYLDMVSQVDAMQISTIHAFARQLIGKLGTAFGYGAEPGIIAGDYHRQRKVSDMLDAYILQKEKAFDRLGIEENPGEWLEYALQKNYRTDRALLQLFESSFASWGNRPEPLLFYRAERDGLIGLRDCNHYLLNQKEKFFRRLSISGDEMRIPTLIQEIRRLQRRIGYEEAQGMALSSKEKSIAILVRENWQAEVVRRECGKAGISIQTHTGGDLYCSQPALDMMTLVNALVHFDEAGYLYSLATSNFFHLDIPKSNLLSIREGPGAGGFKGQAAALIRLMNLLLANAGSRESRWEYIVASLRTKPVLQVIRQIYNALEPWRNCSGDLWKQRDYQLQVDLLFEQLINACHVDSLTINTLQAYLYNCIVSQVSVDSRRASAEEEIPLQCITVHKAKGLAYGHVILPFCSAPLGLLKKSPCMSPWKSGTAAFASDTACASAARGKGCKTATMTRPPKSPKRSGRKPASSTWP